MRNFAQRGLWLAALPKKSYLSSFLVRETDEMKIARRFSAGLVVNQLNQSPRSARRATSTFLAKLTLAISVLFCNRKTDRERRSLADHGFYIDAAAVDARDATYCRKAEACPALAGGEEGAEDVRQVLLVNATPVV